MNKRLIIVFTLILMLMSMSIKAKIVTVYQSEEPIDIKTRMGTQTVIVFDNDIEFASVGNTEQFDIQQDKRLDKLVVSAKNEGVSTNLVVSTKEENYYVFNLVEEKGDYYDLVEVKPKEEIDYIELIKIINNKSVNYESDLKNLVEMYVVDDYVVDEDFLSIEVVRTAIVDSVEKTVYWLRIKNNKSEPITVNSIGTDKRDLLSIVTMEDKNEIESEDVMDYYLFLEDKYLSEELFLEVNIEGEEKEIALSDIPFEKHKIKVFESGDPEVNIELKD